MEMKQGAPTKPRERQVPCQRTRWLKLLLLLCLLHASSALRGPSSVSGEAGGAITIQCQYAPSSVNRHQRKYWCRLELPSRVCRIIVSTNHYTHHDYRGRVALTDFPHSGLFTVRLFRLSLEDAGHYRCGIGARNDMLVFGMNLTVSAGPFHTVYTAPPAPGELTLASFGTASPTTNKWTSGASQGLEGQMPEWNSKATPSAKGRQRPGTARAAAPGTSSRVEDSIKATVSTPESPASNLRSMSTTIEGGWVQGTRSSGSNPASTSEYGGRKTSTEDERPGQETEIKVSPDTARKSTGTIRPSTLISGHVAQESLSERTVVSKQQVLGSTEASSLASGVWILNSSRIDASVEGSSNRSLENTAEETGPPEMPSHSPAVGSMSPPGKGPPIKSAFLEEESHSWILTTVSTAVTLVLLLALVLLRRRLWRNRTSQEAERTPRVTLIQMTHFLKPNLPANQLLDMGGNLLQRDTPPTQPSLTVLEKDPAP